jgi:hypothetical protein
MKLFISFKTVPLLKICLFCCSFLGVDSIKMVNRQKSSPQQNLKSNFITRVGCVIVYVTLPMGRPQYAGVEETELNSNTLLICYMYSILMCLN